MNLRSFAGGSLQPSNVAVYFTEYKFDARACGPNCDPTRPPTFSLKPAQPKKSPQ